jgi:hypothetical protein
MNHQEIVKKLIDSKAVNFDVIGKFVAENGASIATSEEPNFQVLLTKRVIDVCIPPYLVLRSIEDLNALVNVGKELQER